MEVLPGQACPNSPPVHASGSPSGQFLREPEPFNSLQKAGVLVGVPLRLVVVPGVQGVQGQAEGLPG